VLSQLLCVGGSVAVVVALCVFRGWCLALSLLSSSMELTKRKPPSGALDRMLSLMAFWCDRPLHNHTTQQQSHDVVVLCGCLLSCRPRKLAITTACSFCCCCYNTSNVLDLIMMSDAWLVDIQVKSIQRVTNTMRLDHLSHPTYRLAVQNRHFVSDRSSTTNV
jgi:hypothetical protein